MFTASPPSGEGRPGRRVPDAGPVSLLAARATIAARSHLDRRRLLGLVVGVAMALAAVRTVAASRSVVTQLGETRPVVIALDDLTPGQVLDRDDVTIDHWPLGLVPTGHATSTADVVGRTVRATVLGGEPIVEHRIGTGRLGLEADERALALPRPLAPPPVVVGDHVDLVAVGADPSVPEGLGGAIARDLGRARVVAADDDGISVAVHRSAVAPVLQSLAVGTVEIVARP